MRYGVELFFLLSGWLIFSLYYDKRSASAHSYWSRRLARIWPLWAIFVIATLLATTFTPLEFPQNLPDAGSPPPLIISLLLALLFLGWLNPFTWQVPPGGWSIQVEMGHYLLFWPLRRAAPILLLGTVIIGYLTYFVARGLAARPPEEFGTEFARAWLRLGLFGTWPFFVVGGLAFLWSRHGYTWRLGHVIPSASSRYGTLAGVLVMGVLCLTVPVPLGKSYEAAIATALLLAGALIARRWRYTSTALASLGKYSYFMYFAHFWVIAAVLLAARSMDPPLTVTTPVLVLLAVALFLVSLLASWATGRVSWRYLESPLLRLAHRVK